MSNRKNTDLFDELLAGTTFRIIHCSSTDICTDLHYTVRSPFSRIIFQIRGQGRYEMFDQKLKLRQNYMMLVPTDVELTCDISSGIKQYFTYCRVNYADCVDLFSLIKPHHLVISFSQGKTLFRRMIRNFHTDNLAERITSLACLIELIKPFLNSVDIEPKTNKFSQIRRILPVIQYIDQNIDQQLSVKELAAVLHLSPKYFCNMFSSVMGLGPAAYVNQRRILLAKELLLLSPLLIKEVAVKVGFEDQFYFSRLFRRIEGTTPRDYRCQRMPESISYPKKS